MNPQQVYLQFFLAAYPSLRQQFEASGPEIQQQVLSQFAAMQNMPPEQKAQALQSTLGGGDFIGPINTSLASGPLPAPSMLNPVGGITGNPLGASPAGLMGVPAQASGMSAGSPMLGMNPGNYSLSGSAVPSMSNRMGGTLLQGAIDNLSAQSAGAGQNQLAGASLDSPTELLDALFNSGDGTLPGNGLGDMLGQARTGLENMWGGASIDANLAPASVPEAMKNVLTNQSKLSLLSTAGNAVGQMMQERAMPDLGHKNAAYMRPEIGSGYVSGAALKGAATGATLGPAGAIFGGAFGAIKAGGDKQKFMDEWQEAYDERIDNERLNNTNAARQMSDQVYSTYNTQGQFVSPMMEQGGAIPAAPDYETEGGEVMLASPNDKPIAMGQGKYKKMTDNLYKIEGPRHEGGGVPTAGAQQPFTDNLGNNHDSPYVFSDTEDFRFDASEILGML